MTIDWWTIGIQAVNVVILMWLLGRFFWRPVAGMIQERRAEAQKTLAEAEAKRNQATAGLAKIEQTRAGFAAEREAILATAHDDAERARLARLDETAEETAALKAAEKTSIEKERETAEKVWAERASRLAVDIAERLAARLDGPTVRAAFRDWALKSVRALPESVRQSVATKEIALEAISATPLDLAEQKRTGELIGEALGGHPKITFMTDPALIAGLELRAAHLVVSNSWRADLTQILADLAHDKRL
jgi:F-type H+-transporting ATPase subunit b